MEKCVSRMARSNWRIAPRAAARFAALLAGFLGLGLALGACTKCDIPNLIPAQAGPHACHAGPDPQ
jgi:hypothetical protein